MLFVGLRCQDRVLINQWKDEVINGFRMSSQIMANMNKKVRSKYGADGTAAGGGLADGTPLSQQQQQQQHSLEKCGSEDS